MLKVQGLIPAEPMSLSSRLSPDRESITDEFGFVEINVKEDISYIAAQTQGHSNCNNNIIDTGRNLVGSIYESDYCDDSSEEDDIDSDRHEEKEEIDDKTLDCGSMREVLLSDTVIPFTMTPSSLVNTCELDEEMERKIKAAVVVSLEELEDQADIEKALDMFEAEALEAESEGRLPKYDIFTKMLHSSGILSTSKTPVNLKDDTVHVGVHVDTIRGMDPVDEFDFSDRNHTANSSRDKVSSSVASSNVDVSNDTMSITEAERVCHDSDSVCVSTNYTSSSLLPSPGLLPRESDWIMDPNTSIADVEHYVTMEKKKMSTQGTSLERHPTVIIDDAQGCEGAKGKGTTIPDLSLPLQSNCTEERSDASEGSSAVPTGLNHSTLEICEVEEGSPLSSTRQGAVSRMTDGERQVLEEAMESHSIIKCANALAEGSERWHSLGASVTGGLHPPTREVLLSPNIPSAKDAKVNALNTERFHSHVSQKTRDICRDALADVMARYAK
eukprot:Tbor_TRINITY_DN4802_c0_g1::TRINITY_DN4802_c0_g1_i1::g.1414::m.1414